MKRMIASCGLLILSACSNSRKEVMQSLKDNHLLQEKQVNDYVLRLQYLPPEARNEDTALLYFRLNVRNTAGRELKVSVDMAFSYGLDTLFTIVSGTDTLIPVDVSRIANGTLNGAEYMLVFDKPGVRAFSDSKLLFKDWLFTQQYISFPISGKVISHIDSLSLNI